MRDSLKRIIDYLEEDERKDYYSFEGSDAHKENHIYTHICRVRKWIQEEVNAEEADVTDQGLGVQDVLENSQKVEQIAKYLVAQFWLGAEIGIGNSSTRDMSQEQYYELNKNEWNLKAGCLIKAISKINTEDESLKPNPPTGRLIKEGDSLPRKK